MSFHKILTIECNLRSKYSFPEESDGVDVDFQLDTTILCQGKCDDIGLLNKANAYLQIQPLFFRPTFQ
jgi:hypothetical protein